jgi:hypothetical protein
MKTCPKCHELTLDYRPLRGEYRCTRYQCGYAELAFRTRNPAPLPNRVKPPRAQLQSSSEEVTALT